MGMFHVPPPLDWCPTSEQVPGTFPNAFKEKYPTAYIIIDASEVFLKTPSDLMIQSLIINSKVFD